MDEQELILEKEDGVAILTLNRPDKMNAFTTEMYEAVRRACDEIRDDDSVNVLIITGAGRAFSAGSDARSRLAAKAEGARTEEARSDLLNPVMLFLAPAVWNIGKPTIAAVNGVAVGAGLSIALLCDIRIASEKARFGAAWVNMGLIPDCGATYLLPKVIGTSKALEMIYTGDIIDVAEAERVGLVSKVVPPDDLMQTARDLANRIAKGPSIAIELAKRAVHKSLVNDLETQLNFELYAQNVCRGTEDNKEAVKAFMEKRKPAFKGM
jgi:2-(1,2-epoxy-1,2-dihydrophenyl)acetyl-CoA isomerase